MRHSLNIVVAMLSMAAGAWQGTTAQTEQPRSLADAPAAHGSAAPVTLRGCLQKGQAPGTFLLTRHPDRGRADAASAPARAAGRPHADATAVAAARRQL